MTFWVPAKTAGYMYCVHSSKVRIHLCSVKRDAWHIDQECSALTMLLVQALTHSHILQNGAAIKGQRQEDAAEYFSESLGEHLQGLVPDFTKVDSLAVNLSGNRGDVRLVQDCCVPGPSERRAHSHSSGRVHTLLV